MRLSRDREKRFLLATAHLLKATRVMRPALAFENVKKSRYEKRIVCDHSGQLVDDEADPLVISFDRDILAYK